MRVVQQGNGTIIEGKQSQQGGTISKLLELFQWFCSCNLERSSRTLYKIHIPELFRPRSTQLGIYTPISLSHWLRVAPRGILLSKHFWSLEEQLLSLGGQLKKTRNSVLKQIQVISENLQILSCYLLNASICQIHTIQ